MKALRSTLILILMLAVGGLTLNANTRTIETRFALSSDARSEYTTRFPLLSEGRIVVEASWNNTTASAPPVLKLEVIDTEGATVASRTGSSSLEVAHRVTEQDLAKLNGNPPARWTVKVTNDQHLRTEVAGVLRITIPANARTLEDTQFTLLGSGNAQEIAFNVSGPGRVEIGVDWDQEPALRAVDGGLEVSLIHPGESRIYARRQGSSPISVDQQITEQALDRGGRWVVRIRNVTEARITGRVKVIYTPGL